MNKEEKKSRFCRACLLLCLCLLSASCASGEGEYEQEIPMEVALTVRMGGQAAKALRYCCSGKRRISVRGHWALLIKPPLRRGDR